MQIFLVTEWSVVNCLFVTANNVLAEMSPIMQYLLSTLEKYLILR